MKIVINNKISDSISADSEDTDYPASFLLNTKPTKVWKAADGVNTATVTLVASRLDTIAIFGTNAESVSVTIEDPNYIGRPDITTFVDVTRVLGQAVVDAEVVSQSLSNAVWAELDDVIDTPVNIDITFTAGTGQTVEAGVIVCGVASAFKNPVFGLRQGVIDHSIRKPYANGERYYKPRKRARTFEGSFYAGIDRYVSNEQDFYSFMEDLAVGVGSQPVAIRLLDDGSFKWLIYGEFEMPNAVHAFHAYAPISFRITERL